MPRVLVMEKISGPAIDDLTRDIELVPTSDADLSSPPDLESPAIS